MRLARASGRGVVALVSIAASSGCAALGGHPVHPGPGERGTAYVGAAVSAALPLIAVPVVALQVADDDGGRPARVTAAEVAAWLAFANQAFRPAGIRFDFAGDADDFRSLRHSLLNGLDENAGADWPVVKRFAEDAAAAYPGRLVIFFRHGGGGEATGHSFGGLDLGFIAMSGWSDSRHCDHDHLDMLAHELGHYLGLGHTFARTFAEPADAERHFETHGRRLDVFDGDGIADTPPDPGVSATECVAVDEIELGGVVVPLPRRNLMSYYDERDSLSRDQIERVRWVLRDRQAHGLRAARNAPGPGAVEIESLAVLARDNCRTRIQPMETFGPGNWSGGAQLLCEAHGAAPASVTVALPVSAAGRYRLDLFVTRAPDYGVVDVLVDDEALGLPFDAFAPVVLPSGAWPLGEIDLSAGPHRLTFRARTKNPASTGTLMGLDAIDLSPAAASAPAAAPVPAAAPAPES